jgi:cellobiose-specific phosphotransferase system component IIC
MLNATYYNNHYNNLFVRDYYLATLGNILEKFNCGCIINPPLMHLCTTQTRRYPLIKVVLMKIRSRIYLPFIKQMNRGNIRKTNAAFKSENV